MRVNQTAVALSLLALLTPRLGRAVEHPLLGGTILRLRASPLTQQAQIDFRGDAALSLLADPRCPAVSRLRLATSVSGFTQIDLPCANWHALGSSYLYIDRYEGAGGVRRILLQPDRLFVQLSGTHYAHIRGPIPFAEVTLAVGGESACGRFVAFKLNTPGRVVAAAGSGPCHPRPNFLIVNLDDTRADGIDKMATVLSRLASEGVSFRNAFVVDSLCAPSRASLLTGLDGRHSGVRALSGTIGGAHLFRENGADRQTIAVWLQAAGYQTGLFGKYINGYGDSESTAGPNGTFYVPPGWSRWRGMKSTEHYGGVLGPTYVLVDEYGGLTTYDNHTTDEQYSTDLLAREARDFVADSVRAGQNFFAYYAPYASHVDTPDLLPHPAARHYNTMNLPLWRPASWNEPDVSDKPRWVQGVPLVAPIPGAVNDLVRQLAYETLLAVDEQIGLFLDQFDALGVANDTVIIFTSDNGVTWGEHRLFHQGKKCPYEECLRVPMIVRYPRFTTAQVVREVPILNTDIAPTIAELSGVPPPVAVDGVSFAPWVTGPPPPQWRDDFLIENWRGAYDDRLTYTGRPTDGDQLRVFYGPTRAQPRAAAWFEFDNGSGAVTPGAIPVAIGADADATFANLGTAIVAAVPFTGQSQNTQQHQLTTLDLTPDHTGVYFWIERDQGGVIQHAYPLPDYFGVRDVANGFTYVEHESGEVELYDLSTDPGQLDNVAAEPSYAAERGRLAQRLMSLAPNSGGP